MHRAAVVFDRDGVLVVDVGYPHQIEDLELFPDTVPALRRIQAAGYVLAVVSNQSGVARGFFTLADVAVFNRDGRAPPAVAKYVVRDLMAVVALAEAMS